MRQCFSRFLITACLLLGSVLHAELGSLGIAGKKATRISEKRMTLGKWNEQSDSTLTRKTFPIQEWGKHYSSLGRKRASVGTDKSIDRKVFESKTKQYPVKQVELSRWNERIADLNQKARVATDQRVNDIEERRIYGMMLQDAEHYREMSETLSLRDLNRFQFRRNHQADGVPVQQAGSGESK